MSYEIDWERPYLIVDWKARKVLAETNSLAHAARLLQEAAGEDVRELNLRTPRDLKRFQDADRARPWRRA